MEHNIDDQNRHQTFLTQEQMNFAEAFGHLFAQLYEGDAQKANSRRTCQCKAKQPAKDSVVSRHKS